MRSFFRTSLITLCVMCLLNIGVAGAADMPKVAEPALFTSLGQSPDAKTLSVLAKRAKMTGEFKPLATAADMKGIKTLFVAVGVSLKGFGSAGINLDTESKRCDELVKAAKENGVFVVLVHIGGEGRRDSMTNLLLEQLAAHADGFIVYSSGNIDGYFEKAAGNKPLIMVPKAVEVVNVLKGMIS